jgi:DNA polymerase elongation subunit (family B)
MTQIMRANQIITIDCETLPTALPFEEKAFWETNEEYRKTALDGNLGRLLCIGYTREFSDNRKLEYGCLGWNAEAGSFETDEAVVLAGFWKLLRDFNRFRDTIVGHNIMDFDLPFIIKRSIINGIRPTVDFCFARYQRQPIFDTMREWDCWNFKSRTSLDKLAIALNLPSPKDGEITGANLYDAYLEGRYREIYEYCMRDVKTTRNIYRKMNFTFPQTQPAETKNLAALAG